MEPPFANSGKLVLRMELKMLLPIGWGTIFKGENLEIIQGELADTSINFYVAAGRKLDWHKYLPSTGGKSVQVEMNLHAIPNSQPYMPAGRNGFRENSGKTWELEAIQLIKPF